MNARQEVEKLKNEFISLNTEEERRAFDVKFHNHIDSLTEAQKKEFADAFSESARELAAITKRFSDEATILIKLEEIFGIISMAYLARKYFHESESWLSQKLNRIVEDGIMSSFTDDELKILHFALADISEKIKNTARLLI